MYIAVGTLFELLGIQSVTTEGMSMSLPAPLSDINAAIAMGLMSYGVIMSGGIASNGGRGILLTLKEFSLPLVGCRLTNADKTAAIVDKFPHCCKDFRICPVLAAGLCSVRITYIDDHIKIIQQLFILTDIVKADKGNIKRRTT